MKHQLAVSDVFVRRQMHGGDPAKVMRWLGGHGLARRPRPRYQSGADAPALKHTSMAEQMRVPGCVMQYGKLQGRPKQEMATDGSTLTRNPARGSHPGESVAECVSVENPFSSNASSSSSNSGKQ